LKTFFTRTLTAGGFVAVLLSCTYFSQWSFITLFEIITILGLVEFYTLAEKGANKPHKYWGTIVGSVLFISTALVCAHVVDTKMLLINIPFLFSIFIIELYTKSPNPFRNIAFTILGIIYVALPFSLLNYIVMYTGTYSHQIIFGFFFILWCNDSGAYLAGSAFGKRKLFARISPGKSWEGSAGGALLAYVVVLIIHNWYTTVTVIDWMVIAAILVVIGTLGDLVESLYKRSKNVKDSGSILPGHGGILDRFDSLIMATPFVFTYLYIIKFFN
jgi:phosphatidate cytidylyltransferase